MKPEELTGRNFEEEFTFTATRSSGPGGQNINKVNTRIELRFNVINSKILSEDEKQLILSRLATRINNDGELILFAQSERTQLMNKKAVARKFFNLIATALTVSPERVSTKPTLTSVSRRLGNKRIRGIRKRSRKIYDDDQDN